MKGEYPVAPGLILGHEAVGVIHERGPGITGYQIGQRVLVGAITPCGQREPCLSGHISQCMTALGGWRFGNTIDGVQAEYARIPFAQANLAVVRDSLTDEDVVLLADIDALSRIRERTGGRGVDVAIEALGTQAMFENALRALKPGGIFSSVGVYSAHLGIPVDAFGAGLADQTIVTTLCPGGKERMYRLMRLVEARRIDLRPLLTHHFAFEDIVSAYDLFSSHREHVLKVAVTV